MECSNQIDGFYYFWHWKRKLLICGVTSVIILSLEPEPRRSKICQCGISSRSMTQIFVPQLCQLHLSSGPRRCGGAGVEERWSCQWRDASPLKWQSECQRSPSLLGVGVKPLRASSSLLKFVWGTHRHTWLSLLALVVQLNQHGYITVINLLCPRLGF